MRNILLIILAGSLISGIILFYPIETKAKEKNQTSKVENSENKIEDSIITLVAVGDMMLGTNFRIHLICLLQMFFFFPQCILSSKMQTSLLEI